MFRNLWVFIIILILVSGCAPATQSTPIPLIDNATSTPSPIPTATRTALPTATLTASITPLPTIPTFTPTFDVSTIVTVTPAPQAECPKEGEAPQVNFASETPGYKYVSHTNINDILDYLNSGGQLAKLSVELNHTMSLNKIEDITHDGIPDLVVISGLAVQRVNMFWCENGQYSLFPKDIIEADSLVSDEVVFELHDLNRNGVLEVLAIGSDRTGLNINMLEWNRKKFIDLTASDLQTNAWMSGGSKNTFKLVDLENDGVFEMILNGLPNWWYYPGEPLRAQIDTYRWNGKTFSPSTRFDPSQYRFQAIQDGDIESLDGKYGKALEFYVTAIESNKLDWWSQTKFELNRAATISGTPSPDPTPDNTEYPRLAAYAYYRIMLLHLVEENKSDATTAYNTLQEKFGNDQYGQPYIEMAIAFWNTYQSTHKMYDGCAAAIQYAAEHPDILIPLGSDYHGSQSHQYKPEDVCPFR